MCFQLSPLVSRSMRPQKLIESRPTHHARRFIGLLCYRGCRCALGIVTGTCVLRDFAKKEPHKDINNTHTHTRTYAHPKGENQNMSSGEREKEKERHDLNSTSPKEFLIFMNGNIVLYFAVLLRSGINTLRYEGFFCLVRIFFILYDSLL